MGYCIKFMLSLSSFNIKKKLLKDWTVHRRGHAEG